MRAQTLTTPKPRVDLAAVRMVMRRTGGRFKRPSRLRLRDGG
jgi:hypothetical protein